MPLIVSGGGSARKYLTLKYAAVPADDEQLACLHRYTAGLRIHPAFSGSADARLPGLVEPLRKMKKRAPDAHWLTVLPRGAERGASLCRMSRRRHCERDPAANRVRRCNSFQ